MFKKFSRKKQLSFISLWSKLKRTGIPDKAILIALKEDYQNVYGPNCKEIEFCIYAEQCLRSWSDGLGGFDQAMIGWFDDDIIVAVSSVFASNNVQESIQKLISQLLKWHKIKQKIIVSVFFNTLIVLFAVGIFIGLTFAASMVAENMKEASQKISSIGEIFVSVNMFIKSFFIPILAFIFALLVAWLWTMFFYVGEHRSSLDTKLPFFGFYRANEASRFFMILSLLVTSGKYSLRKALDNLTTSNLCSSYLLSHIDEMQYRLKHQQVDTSDSNVTFDKIDTGLLPSFLRMQLLAMQRQHKKSDKTDVLTMISDSLIEDGGENLVRKVEVVGKAIMFSTLLFVILCAAAFLELVFSMSSSMGSSV